MLQGFVLIPRPLLHMSITILSLMYKIALHSMPTFERRGSIEAEPFRAPEQFCFPFLQWKRNPPRLISRLFNGKGSFF
jgi:hypothetical protein